MKNKLALLLITIMLLSIFSTLPGQLINANADSPTVIDSLPYTIDTPGIYVINTDLSTSGDGINITTGNVTIIGNGHTITGANTGTGIIINSSENVTIKDLTIRGFHYGINASHISSSSWALTGPIIDSITIEDCDIGIYLYWIEYPGGVLINNTVIRNSTDYGIYAYTLMDLIVKNSVIEGSNGSDIGIYAYYSYPIYLYNITVKNAGIDGIRLDYSYYINIVDSKITNNTGYGMYAYYNYVVSLLNNEITGNMLGGIKIDRTYWMILIATNISLNNGNGTDVIYSYGIYINNSIIANNTGSGIYLDPNCSYTYVYSNQIMYNGQYGIYAQQNRTALDVSYNVFWVNNESPQAYDENSIGNWHENYWSDLNTTTYDFYNNSDASPLSEPLYDLKITGAYLPTGTISSPSEAYITISNPTPGYAENIPVSILAGHPPKFNKIPFTWISVDPSSATTVSGGDVVEDYGNYTLIYSDDDYFIYKLPWPINLFGQEYQYISVTTNGYIEFLKTNVSVLEADYDVYTYGEHRTWYNPNESYGIGVTTLFAYSADLYATNYVGAFNLGDKIVIVFNGSTYEDQDDINYPVQYEIIISNDGSIIISLGEIKYHYLDGEGFTGLYFQPFGLEIPAGYMLPSNTSYMLNPSLKNISTKNITLEPFSTVTIGLPINPFDIGYTGTSSIWIKVADPPAESDPYDDYYGPLLAPIATVGGELVSPTGNNYNSVIIALTFLGTLAIAIKIVRKK